MMDPIVKNVLTVIASIVVDSIVNMEIILLGSSSSPSPEGMTMENIAEYIHLFKLQDFIFPFLTHALGTLVGAIVEVTIAAIHKNKFTLALGAWFLAGGIANCFMIPSPT